MHHPTLSGTAVAAVALLSAIPTVNAGMYTKKSPVLQLDAKNYEQEIGKTNYTSIVEFYAPWCGHCQNLKPAYEKAAKNLAGLAKVAAVNCDEDSNKQLCGAMGVKGFPTLKIVRPARKAGGKPVVEDYNGPRTATGIVEAAVDRMNNHVRKVSDKDVDAFLAESNGTAKALLFSEKGVASALLKAVAIDFLDVITVAQVRSKEAKAVELFGVEKFPTLVLLPGGDKEGVVYDGELKKEAIVQFLSQAGTPNPDPPAAKAKADKKKTDKKAEKTEKKAAKAKKGPSGETKGFKIPTDGKFEHAEPAAEPEPEAPAADDTTAPAEEPQKPVVIVNPPIKALSNPADVIMSCLMEKSTTCVLALVPQTRGEKAGEVLTSLSNLVAKHKAQRALFPFYEVAKENEAVKDLVKELGLTKEVELIAINARRNWWRHFEGEDFGDASVESWVDQIRMSEGVKKKLPEGLIAMSMPTPGGSAAAAEKAPEAEPVAEQHDEL